MQSFLPRTPINRVTGEIFLPAVLPDRRGGWLPSVPETVEPGMPLYRARAPFEGIQFGKRKVMDGEAVAYLGWPSSKLEPANDVALRVVAYHARYNEHPDFPVAPWCELNGLHLPELPVPEALVPENRPAYVGVPPPRGFTPPAWASTPKIPARTYTKRALKYSHGDDAA
jgi:hypothetical protein